MWCTVPAACMPALRGGGVVAQRPPRSDPRASQPSRAGLEAERVRQQRAAALGVVGVGARGVEALERELARDLGVVGDQRRVGGLDDGELVIEPLGVGEPEALASRSDSMPGGAEALGPEVERLGGGDAPDDAVDHPGAGAARRRAGELEEGEVGAGAALLVGVEEVVDARLVLVDRLLDQPQPQLPA